MIESSRARYERLLRWYPAAWRARNGQVMLSSLEEHALNRGRSHPSVAEAWSIRAHGVAARTSWRVVGVLAVIALLAHLISAGILLLGFSSVPSAGVTSIVLGTAFGPAALSLAGVALLVRSSAISAPAAIASAIAAVVAWSFAGLTAMSWSVGFDEADAGTGMSPFGSSTVLFFGLACLAGTAALCAPASSLVRGIRHRGWRLTVATVIAVLAVVPVGGFGATNVGSIMLAVIVLVTAARQTAARSGGKAPSDAGAPTPGAPTRGAPDRATPWARSHRLAVLAVAVVAGVGGLASVVFALTGSLWTELPRDSTHAMSLGLAAGAVCAAPLAMVAGIIASRRWGDLVMWSGGLATLSLLFYAVGQLYGSESPQQWPHMLASIAAFGGAVALPMTRLVPPSIWLRVTLGVLMTIACAVFTAAMVITAAGFVAPVAAIALVMWALRGSGGQPAQRRVLHTVGVN